MSTLHERLPTFNIVGAGGTHSSSRDSSSTNSPTANGDYSFGAETWTSEKANPQWRSTFDRRLSNFGRHRVALLARKSRAVLALAGIGALLLLASIVRKSDDTDSRLVPTFWSRNLRIDDLVVRPNDFERVTLISVYGGNSSATYLPMLFQTAVQNQKSLDLLFVNIDNGGGCMDLSYVTDKKSPTYGSNIKHLCLTELENDKYYKRFICKGYKGGCDARSEAIVMDHLETIRMEAKEINDEIYNTFKPWRGIVYKEHLRTKWWGWFDADQLIGNFDQLLPKDIMNNFDMILPAPFSPAQRALFLPGQLTFFKNNPKMERVCYRYKPLSSIEHIHLLKRGSHDRGLDEGEYSVLYLNKLTEVDIARLDTLQGPEPLFGDRRIIIADGHILSSYRHITRDDIQLWFNRIHNDEVRGYRVGKTMTEYGKTENIITTNEEVMYCNEDAWNPINTCPEWKPSYASRNILYRKNGSGWKLRREPRMHFAHDWMPASMEPKLFVHFLMTKLDSDFWRMPTVVESGFARERLTANWQPGNGLRKNGRKVAVYEMSNDWWGSWEMTVGSLDPPRGFDYSHILRKAFGNGDEDYYWGYHTYAKSSEILPGNPAPRFFEPWHHTADVVPAQDW